MLIEALGERDGARGTRRHTPAGRRRRAPSGWTAAVTALLAAAFALRLWGIGHGLPYAYNADENANFVPRAIGMFGHDGNPHYFVNPPALTYLLHGVLSVWFGGGRGVSRTFAADPGEVFLVARVTVAALGTVAVGLLYLAGARLFDRRAGLLAAALLAFAFLPVFYAKLALNDVPTLAPVCLGLWASAGILRCGRARDFALAGAAVGLAAATKYTGGIVLVPLLGAAGVRWGLPGGRRAVGGGLALAAAAALVAFAGANPYAILSPQEFLDGLAHQSDASSNAAGKLGLTQDDGFAYYAWVLTWGLGWVPALAALAGAARLWLHDRALAWVLTPAPVLFLVFMGLQERYFGRWLLPVLPILCLLAAGVAVPAADRLARGRPGIRTVLVVLAGVALCAQGAAGAVHAGRVLSREDTRAQTRAWMVDRIPATQAVVDTRTGRTRKVVTRVVVEPVVPDGWVQDAGRPSAATANGNRWVKWTDAPPPGGPGQGTRASGVEDYERTLRPELIDAYERRAFCWVVTGSTQRGRAEADPAAVPGAVAYYAALERRSDRVRVDTPFAAGARPVAFNFDWSFDAYPRAYERPGPVMQVYRLRGGRCRS